MGLIDRIVLAIFVAMLAATVLGVFDDPKPSPAREQERRPAPPVIEHHALEDLPKGPLPTLEIDSGDTVQDGIGTAFSLDSDGVWLTARHVVDGCDRVGLTHDLEKAVRVRDVWIHPEADLAILSETAGRPSVSLAQRAPARGDAGYGIGYPQGEPAGVAGRLLGETRSISRGRLEMDEPVLAWIEDIRVPEFSGSLGGLSGGPLFAEDGTVIGVVVSESLRRGRFFTAAPSSIDAAVHVADLSHDTAETAFDFEGSINFGTLGPVGDELREIGSVSLVLCLVD